MLRNSTSRDVILNRRPKQSDLNAGDLAINAADGTAWTKLLNNQVVPLRAWAIGTGSAVQATESSLGVVRLATQDEIENGNSDAVITATQFQPVRDATIARDARQIPVLAKAIQDLTARVEALERSRLPTSTP